MNKTLSLVTVADDPSWAAPEIRVKTHDGERVKQLRCVLPIEEGSQLVVGRGGPGTDLIIEDDHVSRVHLRFFVKNGQKMADELDYVAMPEAVTKVIADAWKAQVKDAAGKAVWN